MLSRTLVVGDVHACAAELGKLLELAGAERVIQGEHERGGGFADEREGGERRVFLGWA